jgi:hypothetical protein
LGACCDRAYAFAQFGQQKTRASTVLVVDHSVMSVPQ